MSSIISRMRHNLRRTSNEVEEVDVEVVYTREVERQSYKLVNNNDYDISVYWGVSSTINLKFLQDLNPYTETSIRAYPSQRFVIIPKDEFNGEPPSSINIEITDKFIIGDYYELVKK